MHSHPEAAILEQSTTELLCHERPIFIFGCPRSGTSLLTQIINAHSRIAVPFESYFYTTFYPLLKFYGDLNISHNRERLIRDILSTEVIRDWVPRPVFEAIARSIQRYSFSGIVAAFMQTWTLEQGKERWGEKTPGHLFYWPTILKDFPNLQVIHIIRDGRDVALSWKSARFGPKHVYPLAHKWMKYLRSVEELKAALGEDSFLEIRYEELVSNPEEVVRTICAFLKEDFEPNMLSFYQKQSVYPTDSRNQQNLSKPVLSGNANKWSKKMKRRDLNIFEAVAGSRLEQYGYQRALENPEISSFDIFKFKYIEHPPRKAWAMIQNRKGHINGLRQLMILIRLNMASSASK